MSRLTPIFESKLGHSGILNISLRFEMIAKPTFHRSGHVDDFGVYFWVFLSGLGPNFGGFSVS